MSDYRPGDVIFFNFDGKKNAQHVGLCEDWDGQYTVSYTHLDVYKRQPLDWEELFDTELWQTIFRSLTQHPDTIVYFLEFLLLMLVMCAAMFMTFYLAMAIGHLFSKRRILMSVIAFFLLNILDSVVTSSLHHMDALNLSLIHI